MYISAGDLASHPRILPDLDPERAPVASAYWTSGADGVLLLPRCAPCERWLPPFAEGCADCGGPAELRPVAGTGTVFTWSVAHKQFHPEVPTPVVLALVELDEDPVLRLVTDLVEVDTDEVQVGLPVRVAFEDRGTHHVPVFTPAGVR